MATAKQSHLRLTDRLALGTGDMIHTGPPGANKRGNLEALVESGVGGWVLVVALIVITTEAKQ